MVFSNHLNHTTTQTGAIMQRITTVIFITLVIFFLANTTRLLINPIPSGIIAINEWPHGVLLCGDKHTTITSAVANAGSGVSNHYLQDHYGAWTINAGHLDDPELKELERVVSFTCAYNYNKKRRTHNHLITNDGSKVEFKGMQLAIDTEGQLMMNEDELANHLDNDCDGNFNVILVK